MSTTLRSTLTTLSVTAILGVTISACGDDSSGTSDLKPYPDTVRKQFVDSCVPSAEQSSGGKLTTAKADDLCRRTLTCIEGKLTEKQFETATKRMLSGEANPDVKTMTKCAQDQGKATK